MQLLNNKIFIQYEDGSNPIKEFYTLDDGQKLYISGEERPEWHAKCIAIVAESGVNGIVKGDRVLVDYRVMFRYKWVGETRVYENEITLPDGRDVFVCPNDLIIAVYKEGKWVAYGDYCLLKEHLPEDKTVGGIIVSNVAQELAQKWVEATFLSGSIDGVSEGDVVKFEKEYRSLYSLGIREEIIVIQNKYIVIKQCKSQV